MTLELNDLLVFAPAVLAIVLVAGALGWLFLSKSSDSRRLRKVFKNIASEHRTGLVIPDGMDGEIQLQHILLTPTGILVVDLKQANGPVFAGEKLETWSVMEGKQRYKFKNPLASLRARTAAVRALAKDVPVHGRVVFTGEADFVGGRPEQVLTLEELADEFSQPGRAGVENMSAFHSSWQQLQLIANH